VSIKFLNTYKGLKKKKILSDPSTIVINQLPLILSLSKKTIMKTITVWSAMLLIAAASLLTSCEAPVKLTSWKNPAVNSQVSKVVIMPLFEKIEYMKPFEISMAACFNKKGLKAIGSLDFLNPTKQYPIDEIKHRCDSLGADAILLFIYQGTDKTDSYIPPTTYYTGGYGGYGGYWGGGYWGGYGGTVTTGGYWTTTHVINLSAKLYVKGSKDPLWTGEIAVTDPEYVDQAANTIGQQIIADWQQEKLIKFNQAK
jgi:hypothetical protein